MAIVDELHRLAAFQGQQRAVARHQRGELLLAAEGAAHRGLLHANFLQRQLQGDGSARALM
jgi:hypothetical protein